MHKIKMFPGMKAFRSMESGIKRVVEAYTKLLPNYGWEIVPEEATSYDLIASHASAAMDADVVHCHGLYWSEEYESARWELVVNANVIASVRQARSVTVPSRWVAESFQRDMRFTPFVVPHGIDAEEWKHHEETEGYILWNKNRHADVCSPYLVGVLAKARSDVSFVSTFAPREFQGRNIRETGVVPHDEMKQIIQRSFVYLSTTKETFGIGVLEAMAAGIPVLGVGWGGNVDLIEHGVNGYLAEPGNEDDLINGLEYCIKYRNELGENGRNLVKQWTWERAVEKLAHVYRMSMIDTPPSVTVIIPSYNYADKVKGAIKSAINQTYKPAEVIVVDDGSTDDTESVVSVAAVYGAEKGVPVKYIRQDNGGVAIARNRGISEAHGKYICCLDADDTIKPDFLKVCVTALENDRSLGIAYTGLEYVKADGESGVSDWPGQFDYNKQLERKNQVPTCCVYKRKMWERLGGYKQRYAPDGAGAEDAEFWLRAGAYGYNARKVTELPLFTYSWETGRVSGNPDYKEVDWTVFHPWTEDKRHPFASIATPENTYSHWVRSYDMPVVSVIIPVSRDHAEEFTNALDSLEGQTERGWEAIIVDDTDGQGSELIKETISATYPYAKYVVPASGGAGAARNAGVMAARGSFLLFLDADDWLYPKAIEMMLDAWEDTGNISYSDYVGKAYIDEASAQELGSRLLHYNHKKGEAVVAHYSFDYECERALRQPDPSDMYIWCLITALVPKVWHEEIGGFDESMPSWEDWDYWIRMARAGKCFTRIEEPLVVYRFYTGVRREIGLHQYETLVEYLTSKLDRGELPMPCGCRGNTRAAQLQRATKAITPASVSQEQQGVSSMQDKNMVLCVYTSPNQGQHKVVGMRTKTNYGYRGGGEVFYVHRADIEVAPHLFRPKEEVKHVVEKAPEPPPAPPNAIPEPKPVAAPPQPTQQPVKEESYKIEILELEEVPGVTQDIADSLRAIGISSVEQLGELDVDTLLSIKGVGEKRAGLIIKALQELK